MEVPLRTLLTQPQSHSARRTAVLAMPAAAAGRGREARELQAIPTASLVDERVATARRCFGTPDDTARHALVDRLLAEVPAPA